MLTKEHRTLIQLLNTKTEDKALVWVNGESRHSFIAKTKENSFKVGKYFAGDDSAPCLNLSTYNPNGSLLLDIVICKGIQEQKEDYEVLNALYLRIEETVLGGNLQKDVPVVTSITQSLQQI
jgi:hypothetical protein